MQRRQRLLGQLYSLMMIDDTRGDFNLDNVDDGNIDDGNVDDGNDDDGNHLESFILVLV